MRSLRNGGMNGVREGRWQGFGKEEASLAEVRAVAKVGRERVRGEAALSVVEIALPRWLNGSELVVT